MGYMLIRVHSYECDQPGCEREQEHAEPSKREADKIMVKEGWIFVRPGLMYCPQHGPRV